MNELIIDNQTIQNKIHTIRGVQVMLDRDLAEIYKVETRALKQAVNRNIDRFPSDFMFKASESEIDFMVSQSVIPSKQHLGGSLSPENIELKTTKEFHDRFLVIDKKDIYHIGASVKDLGNKVFAFSKLNIDMNAYELLEKLK